VAWTEQPEAWDALFSGLSAETRCRFEQYLLTKPQAGPGKPTLQSRAFALYDPFADRRLFPAGVRYCLSIFAGCTHGCWYCYTRNCITGVDCPRPKAGPLAQAQRDVAALRALDLPPVPLHISNSTDPF